MIPATTKSTLARLATILVPAGTLAGLLATLAPAVTAAPTHPADDRRGLHDAERTWVRALETGDVSLLDGLVDNEFTFIGPDGELEERAAYLSGYRNLPAQGISVSKVDLFDLKLRVLGDVGIVTGRAIARVKVKSDNIVENVRFTRVYRRRGQGWRMVAGQGTRLAPPPAPQTAAATPGR
jgi:ketosteroid isomerase-like protein